MICWRMDWRMLRHTELAISPPSLVTARLKMGRLWFHFPIAADQCP